MSTGQLYVEKSSLSALQNINSHVTEEGYIFI